VSVRPFAQLLREALARSGLSQRELTRRLGINSTLLSKVLRDQRTLSPEIIDALSEELALRGREREDFRLAALLAHCPAEVATVVRGLQDEVAELRERLVAAFPSSRVAEADPTRRRPGKGRGRRESES
jgi:transcriptional regulator with XRE-family HTH domain